MQILEKQQAHAIVERAQKIIPFSINVMDHSGMIIASSDTLRENTSHEGAILAINSERDVDIDVQMSQYMQGVKPGINCPIYFEHKIIGVVGISGEPEQVRAYGELLKMTAELIVEQAFWSHEIYTIQHQKNVCMRRLIEGADPHLPHITHYIPDTVHRISIIIDCYLRPSVYKNNPKIIENLIQQLNQILEPIVPDQLILIESPRIIVFYAIQQKDISDSNTVPTSNQSILNHLKQLFEPLIPIANQSNIDLKISIGDLFQTPYSIADSFKSAQSCLISSPLNVVSIYKEQALLCLINQPTDTILETWRHLFIHRIRNNIIELDKSNILLKTLKVWFENHCDHTKTAELLHIHRNTLRYRIDKVAQATALDIRHYDQKVMLYLALHLIP